MKRVNFDKRTISFFTNDFFFLNSGFNRTNPYFIILFLCNWYRSLKFTQLGCKAIGIIRVCGYSVNLLFLKLILRCNQILIPLNQQSWRILQAHLKVTWPNISSIKILTTSKKQQIQPNSLISVQQILKNWTKRTILSI